MLKNRKKILRSAIFLVIFLVALEFSPFLLYPLKYGSGFSRGKIQKELEEDFSGAPVLNNPDSSARENEYLGDAILNPFTGYTSVPHPEYNRFAFPGIDPILKKSPQNFNICLLGGSVAMGLYGTSRDRMIARLKEHPSLRDKNVQVALFALGGFKQPQQLMTLNYFISQGAEYDVVINLDGFNDIVLPYTDNLPFHVYPSYPRHWLLFSQKKLDTRTQLILGKQELLKEDRALKKRSLAHSFWRHSNFALVLWKMSDLGKQNELFLLEEKLRETLKTTESSFQTTGPAYQVSDTSIFFSEQARVWATCSRQMNALGSGMGFRYYHFLQPNQYVKGTKKFTEEENQIALEAGPFDYKHAAEEGYPMLIKEGKLMKADAVPFFDLTSLFANESGTVYNDKCCHFNVYGYGIISDFICSTILKDVH